MAKNTTCLLYLIFIVTILVQNQQNNNPDNYSPYGYMRSYNETPLCFGNYMARIKSTNRKDRAENQELGILISSAKLPASQLHQKGNFQYGVSEGTLRPQECAPRCTNRCSKTAFKKPCLFFCQKCCAKCLCVPAGTYGNKQACPCYNNWKTKRGGPKCP